MRSAKGIAGAEHRVPYERQTLAHPNPVARFAHRRRLQVALAIAARHLPPGGTLLDFGAGTGEFLKRFGDLRPDAGRLAVEPFMASRHADIRWVRDLGEVAARSVDAVSAFEVCEHLAPQVLDGVLIGVRRVLRPGGRLIVSVPIMEGLALPLKEAARALLFRHRSDYGAAELAAATLGRPVPRASDVLTSHKGFAHRALLRRLGQEFQPVEAELCPFPALPWWTNSQSFSVFAARELPASGEACAARPDAANRAG